MPENHPSASPDEELLARILSDIERSPGASSIERLVDEHPQLAREIRELVEVRRVLDRSRGSVQPAVPDRLGEFRIVRRLQTGGMGEVYEAWQEPLHRRVALKVLRRGHHSIATRERFMREQRALARLHQTNIVPIHTAGAEGAFEFFAMPFIDGAALSHVIEAAVEFGSTRPGTKTPSIADLVVARRETAPQPTPPPPAVATVPRPTRMRPSLAYLQSVARVMADAARAVQHAHELGIHHRDIKPSNIMVEAYATEDGKRLDQCWVIDFGLASYREEISTPLTLVLDRGVTNADVVPSISGIMGTPAYMAPEQFEGRGDHRADVWGLGVTLYELLTLQPAFRAPAEGEVAQRIEAVRQLVCHGEPERLRGLIPRDLEAICFRALQKDPRKRYQSARELADDLRRWLRCEAVAARSRETPLLAAPIRSVRWAQRNKGWATAAGISGASLVAVAVLSLFVADRLRLAALEALMLPSLARPAGWSDRAREVAASLWPGTDDDRIREVVTATLAGVDAHQTCRIDASASAVAFDGAGNGLILGGTSERENLPAAPARLWRCGEEPQAKGMPAPGPVACRPDGTAVQFLQADDLTYHVWDLTRGALRASCSVAGIVSSGARSVEGVRNDPVLALSADCSTVAAALVDPASGATGPAGVVAIWDANSGRLLHELPLLASAIAFSRDGSLCAAGDAQGRVSIWSLPSGERLADVNEASGAIHALAFGTLPVGSTHGKRGFLLAIGSEGGRVVIWDSALQRLRAFCRGLTNYVSNLVFSPDGALLAGSGADTILWDSSTGATALDLRGGGTTAVAFSADGRQLARTAYPDFGSVPTVTVWNLQRGRGILDLQGLDSPVQSMAISRDGRCIAGVSNDWDIVVWDSATGAPLFRDRAPEGISGDNAGLAFSPDGSALAYMAGSTARMWDLGTGRLRTWDLPRGLVDHLTFDEHGDLIAVRCEPLDPAASVIRAHAACRVRNLSRGDGSELLLEVRDFATKVFGMVLDPRGRYLVIEGWTTGPDVGEIRAVSVPDGRMLWSVPSLKAKDVSSLHVDPTGEFVSYQTSLEGPRTLVAMPNGVPVRAARNVSVIGPGADILVGPYEVEPALSGMEVLRRGEKRPLLRMRQGVSERALLDLSGRLLVFGHADGHVQVADLAAIEQALSDCGVGWSPAGR